MKTFLKSKILLAGAAAAAVASGLGIYVWHEEHRPPLLEITIIALKHGQAIFVRTPDDKRILINAGGNSEIIRHISRILPFYSRRIDAIIATNTAGKNSGGFGDVIERYHIGEAYIPGTTFESLGLASTTDPIFKTFLSALRSKQIPLIELEQGDMVKFSDEVNGTVLFPVPSPGFSYSKASGPEVVLQIEYGVTSVLLLGTATKKIQTFISQNPSIASSTSTSNSVVLFQSDSDENISVSLWKDVNPDYFVFSKAVSYSAPKKSSPNAKKKPHPAESLPTGQKINLREKGIVKIISDGQRLELR